METMNTDTPETDGEWNRLACQDHPEFERNLADFARKMERERDEAREDLKFKEKLCAELTKQLREEQQLHVQTLNERDEARVLPDRLADALNAILNDDPDSPLYKIKEARAALAAWKEARCES
jgi:hypothetical protein